MKEISLSELPRWSPWPQRLLGLVPWTVPARTVEKVEQEYNQEKYARLLKYFHECQGQISPEELECWNYGSELERSWCTSVDNTLYEGTIAEAREQYYSLLRDTLRPLAEVCPTVVELGCGYGYNLWMLKQHLNFSHYVGGDYSANAVRLAELLYRDDPNLHVRQFNYYDPESYRFLAEAAAPVVIFTSHSLEQIPCAQAVFDALQLYQDRIYKVVHFEPVYELYDDSLLGQMRRRYTQMNHYNQDLLEQLTNRPAVSLDEIRANIFGINVFNPTSVLGWSFRKEAA